MFQTAQTTQVITPFGSGYVPMQHGEPTSRNLPTEFYDVAEALRYSLFSEVLKSLRATLALG